MFGGGGGSQVGANVVLTADNSGYDQAMQQSASRTQQLGQAYDSLHQKIDRGFTHIAHASFGIAAADTASVVAATVATARFEGQMRSLRSQADVLNTTFGGGAARYKQYEQAVDSVRTKFGETTSAARELVQTISGFESGGSTQGLAKMASDFEKMSMSTGENAATLAQAVLSLGQAMGTTQGQVKSYNDELTTMAALSNTSASGLANFTASIAPLGRQLNMTQSQLTGFAAAFSKAGQDGYRATNVFSQMTSDIAQSLQSNSPRLQQYANLLGVTTQALKGMQGGTLTAQLFDAIGRQGPNALQTLNTLGYDGLNVTRTISAVTQQAGPGGVAGMLRRSQDSYGNGASGVGKETLGEEFSKARQDIQQAGEALGEAFLPALKGVMTFVDKLTEGVTEFMQGPGGDLVKAMAALVAPAAALAGALVSMHGAFLPLMALLAVKRSSVGTGFMDAMMNRQGETGKAVAAGTAPSRYIAGGYKAGAAVGGIFAPGGTSRMDYILRGSQGGKYSMFGTPAAAAAAEVGAAETGAAVGLFGRGRQLAYRGMSAVERYGWGSQFWGAAEKDPIARYNRFGPIMPFGGAAGAKGTMADDMEAKASQTAASAEARLAAVTDLTANALKGLSASVVGMGASLSDSAAAAAASASASAKMTEGTMAAAAADAKLTLAAGEATGGLLAVAKSAVGSAAMGAVGGAKALGSGALAVGAMGVRAGASAGMGLMDMLGGPIGLGITALMLAPAVKGMFSHPDESRPPNPVTGTGLSFTVAGVQGALPRPGTNFDPNRPSAAALYAAQQGDYQNPFFAANPNDEPDATQAAAMYGPLWRSMSTSQRQSLIADAAKAYSGNVQPLLQRLNDPRYSRYTAESADEVSGVPGGLSALYQLQATQNYSTLQNPTGANLHSAAMDFLNTAGHLASVYGVSGGASINQAYQNAPQGGLGAGQNQAGGGNFFSDYFHGGGSAGNDLVVSSRGSGHLFGLIKGHYRDSLTDTGTAFAKALGQDTSAGGAFATLLGDMPTDLKSGNAQMRWLLQHMSEDQLTSALSAAGEQNITGDQATNLATAIKDFNAHSSKELASAFRGMKLTTQQQRDISNEDATNPSYGAQLLYSKGVTPQQMLKMYNSGLNSNTVNAYLAYGSQQYQTMSPFMSPMTALTGANGAGGGTVNTPLGSISGGFSPLGIAKLNLSNLQSAVNNGTLSGKDLTAANTAVQNLTSGLVQQLQTMKQYDMTVQQMGFSEQQFQQSMHWQAEQEHRTVAREHADEQRQVTREEYNFHLQRKRNEADFARQRRYNETDYHLQRTRAEADYAHQTSLMIKQAAMSMHDIYKQDTAQGFTSAEFLISNNSQQTQSMRTQESQLDTLRNMGLSTGAIQQLGLTSSSNAQELTGLFSQLQQNPSLIDQLNQAVQQRLSAAGALATDESSMTWQEQERQFKLTLDRGAHDFQTSMKRSKDQFDLQLERSTQDFTRQMAQQHSDFELMLTRQNQDYNTAVAHSWATFKQQVSQSMTQLNESVTPLSLNTKDLLGLARKFKGTEIGKEALALAKSTPDIVKVIKAITNLANLKPATPQQYQNPTTNGIRHGGTTSTSNYGYPSSGRGGIGSGLPSTIQSRMQADHPTAGYCLHDVCDVLGAAHGAPNAISAWYGAKGHRHTMASVAPGNPIFFGSSYGGGDGHVAIYAGNNMMWSEDTGAWERKPVWPGVLGWADTINGTHVANATGLKSFARGSWSLPSDMLAQIHKGEMIIPAKVAEVVRSVVSKGQAANMNTRSHAAVTYVDSRSYSTSSDTTFTGDICVTAQDPMQLVRQMQARARLKNLARR